MADYELIGKSREQEVEAAKQRVMSGQYLQPRQQQTYQPDYELITPQKPVMPPLPAGVPEPTPSVTLPMTLGTVANINNNLPRNVQQRQAADYLQQQQQIRAAQDPSNPLLRGLKNYTVDLLGEGVDRFLVNTAPGRFLNRFGQSGGAALGVDTQAAGGAPIADMGTAANLTADIGGAIAGTLTNPSNIGQGLVSAPYQAAQALTQRIAPNAPRLLQRALEGGTAGAIQGGVISGVRGETSLPEVATNVGIGAVSGAVADPLFDLAGRGLQTIAGRLRGAGNVNPAATEQLALPAPRDFALRAPEDFALPALPAPRTRGNANRATPPEVITTADTRPVGLPEGNPAIRQGQTGIPAMPEVRAGRVQEPEVLPASAQPTAPRIDVTPPAAAAPDQVARVSPVRTPELTPQPIRVAAQVDNPAAPVQSAARTEAQQLDDAIQAASQPRLRDRVYNYLDAAEQAARQRIKDRRNIGIVPKGGNDVTDYAIIMAAKTGKGTIKAADFTESLVKEFGESIRPQAKAIMRQTQKILKEQERMASKQVQEAQAFNAQQVGDADSFRGKISRDPKRGKRNFAQTAQELNSSFVDDVAALGRLERDVRGKISTADQSLYKAARLYRGTPEKAHQFVQDRLSPVIKGIEDAKYSYQDLGDYALAKHAQDVNARGMKSGFTDQEIAEVIKKYKSPEMDAAQQELVKINNELLDDLVNAGVISKGLRDELRNRWKNYIPMFRSFDADPAGGFGGGLSKTLANVAAPIKSLKGSERNVIDPIENMIRNAFQSINAAERNRVGRQLANLAKLDTDGAYIRQLGSTEKVGMKNVVNVKVDGKDVKYEVQPDVYRAMLGLDDESSSFMIRMLAKPASVLRAGATLTPEFSLRNPMRDIIDAYIKSETGFNPVTDFAYGLAQTFRRGDLYKEWIDQGGAFGNVLSLDRNLHRQALEKVIKEGNKKGFINMLNPIPFLRYITDLTESAVKVGEYRSARRAGLSQRESAYQARNIMDFARAGSSVRQANKVIAFLNANVQGKARMVEAIKKDPKGVLTRTIKAVTLPTLAAYALNRLWANDKQQQMISDAPDWMRDTFWLLAVPGTDQVLRVPKPFDVAPLFANLPERMLDWYSGKAPVEVDKWAKRSAESLAIPFQLSALLPILEGTSGYSWFRQGDIVPRGEQGLQKIDQYDPLRTSWTARGIAEMVNWATKGEGALGNFASPRIVDNTIRGYTAGLGTYATDMLDLLINTGIKATGGTVPAAPSKTASQLPFLKAFTVDSSQGGQSMSDFYDMRERLQREKASASLRERSFNKVNELDYLNNVASTMSELTKYIKTIERDTSLTAAQKREKIDPVVESRSKLARDAMQVIRKNS